eukprot:CAMPEP_0201932246 /NCGR_PEP_ID=MMETSP0903-20130614/29057_1 /ASSEMBLY_ACC=CAM_ASM_000552 /TAXON_ID=420261 /ORGANISM="Thalassiosira antarctica, Strain CCMP982" /LENGTH=33 /DNA_ID= /DNA_START= /DNA_END= /DNA_ORIENTATION=
MDMSALLPVGHIGTDPSKDFTSGSISTTMIFVN